MYEPIRTFKTFAFLDKTKDGYEVVQAYEDLKDNRMHVIAHRPSDDTYIVCVGYNADDGTWNQGYYDYDTFKQAETRLLSDYDVDYFVKPDKVEEKEEVKVEEEPVTDAKADELRFAEKFGEKALNRFKRLAQKLSGNYKDMTWVAANVETAEDLNEILNNVDFYGYEPIAENEDWIVFNVDNLDMCQKLARGTSWCITAPTAWNTNARFGARYNFYINKNTGDKYCVAMVGNLKEIVDGADNDLVRLPAGVPAVGEGEIVSSVVQEDKSSAEALLQTVLSNIQLLSPEALKNAYADMFGDELDILEGNEVKEFLTEQVQNIDTNELKRYIEEHIDDFAIVREQNRDEDDDDDDYDGDFDDEDEEETLVEIDEDELIA